MKKYVLLFILISGSLISLNAQHFLPHDLFDPNRVVKYPFGAISLDVDTDGDFDVIVSETTVISPRLLLFRNDGTGNLHEIDTISFLANDPGDIDYGDINGDGNIDVLVNMANEGFFLWYSNDGTGNFTEHKIAEQFDVAYWSISKLGDVDNDGDLDIMGPGMWLVNSNALGTFDEIIVIDEIYDLIGNPGNGGIGTNVRGITEMLLEDLNGDTYLDVLYAQANYLQRYIGSESGFMAPDTIGYVWQAISGNVYFASGDLNNDTYKDILISETGGCVGDLRWLRNNANTSYTELTISNSGSSAVSVGDFNGDDYIDVAVIQCSESLGFAQNRVSVFENSQNETFTRKNTMGLADLDGRGGANTIQANDYNNDGLDDLILTSNQMKLVYYENLDNWNFSKPKYLTNTAYQTVGMHHVDVDGDGINDILMASQQDQNISWMKGSGQGAFGEQIIFTDTIPNIYDIGFGDIDGDDLPDLIYINPFDLGWFKNMNDGAFEIQNLILSDRNGTLSIVSPGNSSNIFDLVDLNSDGYLDILLGKYYDDQILWLQNNGTANFSIKNISTSVEGVSSVGHADVDGDSDLDIIATADGTDEVVVFKNNGGVFTESSRLSSPVYPRLKSVIAVDLDGDNDLDLLTGKPSWFENTDGNGTYGSVFSIATLNDQEIGEEGEITRAGDLDNDGDQDFAMTHSNSLKVFINDGSEIFDFFDIKPESDDNPINALEIIDVNQDGIVDILSADIYMPRWYQICFPTTSTLHETICGDSYTINGQTYIESGEYTQILTNMAGCDSTLTLNLILNPTYALNRNRAICQGETFLFGTQNLTVQGSYTETFKSTNLCDSVVTLSLKVNPSYTESTETTICEGETYEFGNQLLAKAGEYVETFELITGCDSTVTINLTVNPAFNESVSMSICEGDTYVFGTQTLSASGIYSEAFESRNTCDSVVTVDLTVNPAYNESVSLAICGGDSYVFGTQILSTSGNYSEAFESINMCDSLVSLDLTVSPVFNESVSITICEGDSYVFGIQNLSIAGIYSQTFESTNMCDSLVSLDLTVSPVFNESVSITICEGNSYVFGTQNLSTAGVYSEVFESINMCDSLVSLDLTVNPIFNESVSITICEGDSYVFGTQNLSTAGIYSEAFETKNNCDSLVSLDLIVNPIFNQSVSMTICEGDNYVFGTQTLSSSGNYTETFKAINTCDSIVSLDLQVNQVFDESVTVAICEGDNYIFGGQTLTEAGNYNQVLNSTLGCDSTVNLTLDITQFNLDLEYSNGIFAVSELADSYQWYSCLNGSKSAVTGATTSSFAPLNKGNYLIEVTFDNCIFLSECITYEPVVLDINAQINHVFPNPTSELLKIETSGFIEATIIDYSGKELMSSKSDEININSISSGSYLLKIKTTEKEFFERIVIIDK